MTSAASLRPQDLPSARTLVTGLQVGLLLWIVDSLFYSKLYLDNYRPPLSTSAAVFGAIIDSASLAALWLAGLALVVRFPLTGRDWKRNAVLLGAIAVVIVPLRVFVLWIVLPANWFPPSPDWGPMLMTYYPWNLQLFGFGIAVAHLIAFQRTLDVARIDATALRHDVQIARLATLRAQLQPHFLFNVLNAVSTLIYSRPQDAEYVLAELSGLLRISARMARSDAIALDSELEFAERYLAVERVRLDAPLRVEWDIDPRSRDVQVPPLILQPLIENVLRHAITGPRAGDRLHIGSRCSDDRLRLVVADNGPGLSENWRERVGIGHTKMRLEELFGGAFIFRVESQPGAGVRVTIEMPL